MDRPRLCRRARARAAPLRARPARIRFRSTIANEITSLGRPTIPSPDMLLGQRSDPASPAETKLPICGSTDQGDLVMISITRISAVRKGPSGHFTCGITPATGKWSAPAANEVAP